MDRFPANCSLGTDCLDDNLWGELRTTYFRGREATPQDLDLQPGSSREVGVGEVPLNPVWRKITDDPRWTEYREAIGMSQERLEAIEFDPWLPE